jgi:hypothetical protein
MSLPITLIDLTTQIIVPDNIHDLRSYVNMHPNLLNISVEQLITSKHKKSYPSRPPNAFFLFRKNLMALPNVHGRQCSDISRIASAQWKELPENIRQFFTTISESCRKMHSIRYPYYDYNFTSNSNKQLQIIGNFERKFMQDFNLRKINKLKKIKQK